MEKASAAAYKTVTVVKNKRTVDIVDVLLKCLPVVKVGWYVLEGYRKCLLKEAKHVVRNRLQKQQTVMIK